MPRRRLSRRRTKIAFGGALGGAELQPVFGHRFATADHRAEQRLFGDHFAAWSTRATYRVASSTLTSSGGLIFAAVQLCSGSRGRDLVARGRSSGVHPVSTRFEPALGTTLMPARRQLPHRGYRFSAWWKMSGNTRCRYIRTRDRAPSERFNFTSRFLLTGVDDRVGLDRRYPRLAVVPADAASPTLWRRSRTVLWSPLRSGISSVEVLQWASSVAARRSELCRPREPAEIGVPEREPQPQRMLGVCSGDNSTENSSSKNPISISDSTAFLHVF